MKKKKTNKIRRYLKVSGRKIRKINRKKIISWISENLKGHPFVLGIAFFAWISEIVGMFFSNKKINELLKHHLKFLGITIGVWFVLVILLNMLRDKQRVRWYFKKRFVFLMLVFFYPIGVILMWTGSRFNKITKVIFTFIFAALFLYGSIRQEKKSRAFLNISPVDSVIELVSSKKKKAFLQAASSGELGRLKLARLSTKEKIKLAVSDIYSRCSPAIVSIKTKDKTGSRIGLGSGFVISKNGLIVTNSHVVASAYQAEVKIGERIFNETHLVKNLPNMDMAILKIDADNLPVLAIGDSDELKSGHFVVALGNPMGFEQSVSSGIVSAVRSGHDMKLIQMTVPVSPGSSGGPVFNEYGEVIGIATVASFFMAQNLNFAIPINYLKKIISDSANTVKN